MDELAVDTRPLTRIWDRDFNLLYSGHGDIGEVIGELFITEDNKDGRTGGRVHSVKLICQPDESWQY